ncbi:MAG: phospho-N-acetylmuramoyl-pentapeptide-transferase [Oscillospiraceae bacterium]|jgi:phospho-N-acetylmuramoyl-pentapeptide-transferase|nr:phospho-N-acetylmuramoyl-pentapeptide-transferase [Oscillospiraceae bacterium]
MYIIALASFIIAVVIGLVLIPILKAFKLGQPIKTIGPVWHSSKAGTPTMGGWIFILAGAAGIFVWRWLNSSAAETSRGLPVIAAIFVFALVFGIIGFIDDLAKIRKKQNEGLTGKVKFLLQLIAALVFLFLMRNFGYLTSNLFIPFLYIEIAIPVPLYFAFAAFVIVGTVNAVNLTDGVDGVLTGVTLPVLGCFALLAFVSRQTVQFVFAIVLIGGLAGYLLFNFHPAKVFMGDTGSLFLGGAICALAFSLNIPLVLVPLCLIYIWTTLSVIIQVGVFKIRRKTRGLEYAQSHRVFKMSPFHHHLEKSGWSEYRIFAVYTIISTVCAIAAYVSIAGFTVVGG